MSRRRETIISNDKVLETVNSCALFRKVYDQATARQGLYEGLGRVWPPGAPCTLFRQIKESHPPPHGRQCRPLAPSVSKIPPSIQVRFEAEVPKQGSSFPKQNLDLIVLWETWGSLTPTYYFPEGKPSTVERKGLLRSSPVDDGIQNPDSSPLCSVSALPHSLAEDRLVVTDFLTR